MVEVTLNVPTKQAVGMLRIYVKVRDEGSYTIFDREGGDTIVHVDRS